MHEGLRFTLEQILFAHHISVQQIVEKAHLDLNIVGTIIKTRRGTAEELDAFFAAVSELAGQRYRLNDIYGMGDV